MQPLRQSSWPSWAISKKERVHFLYHTLEDVHAPFLSENFPLTPFQERRLSPTQLPKVLMPLHQGRVRDSCGSFLNLESPCWAGPIYFLSKAFSRQMPLEKTISFVCWFLLCVSPVPFYLGSADLAPIGWACGCIWLDSSMGTSQSPSTVTSVQVGGPVSGSAMHIWKLFI